MKRYLVILFIGFLSVLFLSSCMKKEEISDDSIKSDGMKDMHVSAYFDWSTTTTRTIIFTSYAQSLVKIATPEGKMLKVAMLSNEKEVEVSFSAPTYLDHVNISFLGTEYELELKESDQRYSFE